MKANFESCLAHLLKHEGGYVNHPSDPGGITNLGVTKKVFEEFVKHPVSEQDMRDLTPEKVEPLYKLLYWDKIKGDNLPTGVDYCVFDAAVNSGAGRASRWLQTAIGVEPDGSIGPKTFAAVEILHPKLLVSRYCEQRLAFLHRLPTWDTFGKGWGRRVKEVESTAQSMCK
jgi:lysozyme family protein